MDDLSSSLARSAGLCRSPRSEAVNRPVLAILLAVLLAFGAMFLVWHISAADPVDVVGRSLVAGYDTYSERAELRAFATLLLTALLGGFVLPWVLSGWSVQRIMVWTWCVAGLVPFLLAAAVGYRRLPVVLVLLTGWFGCGRLAAGWRLSRPDRALPAWAILVAGWGLIFEARTGRLGSPPTGFVACVITALCVLVMLRWLRPGWAARSWQGIAPATVIVLMLAARRDNPDTAALNVSLTCMACVVAGGVASWRTSLLTLLRGHPWLISAGCCVWLSVAAWQMSWSDLLSLAAEGGLLGLLLQIGSVERWCPPIPGDRREYRAWFEDQHIWLIPALLLTGVCVQGWWFGSCASLTAALALRCQQRRRNDTLTGGVLALGIACSCLPRLNTAGGRLDVFHQGQILSAILEFEQGAQLYSEVFPLRSTEFFLGWLARFVLPRTLIGSEIPLQFAAPVLAAGGCLIAYAWTRSVVWSLVIGLAPLTELWGRWASIRDGLLLLCLGIAGEIVRSSRPGAWLWLIPLVVPALFAGYDMAVPVLAGCASAVLAGCLVAGRPWSRVAGGLTRAALIIAGSLGLFIVCLISWQGTGSALAYGELFRDYSRHLTAFFGLPIDGERHTLAIYLKGVAVLAAFAACGSLCWRIWPSAKRRLWALLLAGTALHSLRGLGRSDYMHVASMFSCVVLLAGSLTFEVMLLAVRHRGGMSRRGMTLCGIGAVVVLLPLIPARMSAPWTLWSQLRNLPVEETVVMPPDETLARLVAPDDWLWSVDFGIGNYAQQRRNPTRHALAYCIGSPAEQRRAVSDLVRRPPKVILWDWAAVDGVDKLTRHYLLANHVLRHYQPGDILPAPWNVPYCIPAEPGGVRLADIPAPFTQPQRLGQLPEIWGRLRWPRLQSQVTRQTPLTGWHSREMADDTDAAPGWEWSGQITPQDGNYLFMKWSMPRPESSRVAWPVVRLEFSPREEFDEASCTEWQCPPDGRPHVYLVPIGCHPSWTWRTEIRHMRFTTIDGPLPMLPEAALLEIQEMPPATGP